MKRILYFGLILFTSSCSIYNYQFQDNECDNLYQKIEQDMLLMGERILEYDWYDALADKLRSKYVKSEDKCKTLSEIVLYLETKYPDYYNYLITTDIYNSYKNLHFNQ